MKGLTVEQTNRVLEDFKRKAQLYRTLELLIKVLVEEDDALYSDIQGMLQGNNGKKGVEDGTGNGDSGDS